MAKEAFYTIASQITGRYRNSRGTTHDHPVAIAPLGLKEDAKRWQRARSLLEKMVFFSLSNLEVMHPQGFVELDEIISSMRTVIPDERVGREWSQHIGHRYLQHLVASTFFTDNDSNRKGYVARLRETTDWLLFEQQPMDDGLGQKTVPHTWKSSEESELFARRAHVVLKKLVGIQNGNGGVSVQPEGTIDSSELHLDEDRADGLILLLKLYGVLPFHEGEMEKIIQVGAVDQDHVGKVVFAQSTSFHSSTA